jgi:hypothetical protein
VPIAIPWLLDLSFWLFAIGTLIFLTLCVLIVKALFGTASSAVSWIPWVGSAASSGIHKAEQHVVSVFSKGIDKTQAALGWSWHLQARMLDWLGREINSHANLLWLLANQIPGVGLVRFLVSEVAQAKHAVDTLLHRIAHLHGSVVIPQGKDLANFEKWTRTRVGRLEREIALPLPIPIPTLWGTTKTLEGELSRLWRSVAKGERMAATLAFIGAVTFALSRLGLGWLRCSNTKKVGNAICHANPTEIEALLALTVGAIAIADYQDLVRLMQGVEKVTAEGIQEILKV